MKSSISFWDILTGLSLMAGTALTLLFALIFTNPRSPLNPFPPPTQVSALLIPTSTPTARVIPPTWTPTPRPSATGTLDSLNQPTPTLTPTFFVLPTSTATLVPTWTATSTGTLLPSSTPYPTSTAYIVPTWTQPAPTSVPPTATYTSVPITPSNPTSATETHSVANNTWQNTVSTPAFTWSAPPGATGYFVYLGNDPNGTSATLQTPNSFTAPAALPSGSVNYLRVRTRTTAGDAPGFVTLFTFKFDNVVPTNPTASVSGGLVSGQWSSDPAANPPTFTLSGATDPAGSGVGSSGLTSYAVYWGTSPTGTSPFATVAHSGAGGTFTPGSPVASGATYYLRVRAKDAAGNDAAAWADLFTYKFDNTAPTNPTIGASGGVTSNNWTNVNNVTFTFTGAVDSGSGIAGYYVYFGTSSSGTSTTLQPGNTFNPGAVTDGTYFVRVRPQDNAGNASGSWANFIYKFDSSLPSAPVPPATEAGGATSGNPSNNASPSFSWSASTDTPSGILGYDIYWVAGTNCSAGSPANITNLPATTYNPPALSAPATWYLCVRSRDNAQNASAWAQMFTYNYVP